MVARFLPYLAIFAVVIGFIAAAALVSADGGNGQPSVDFGSPVPVETIPPVLFPTPTPTVDDGVDTDDGTIYSIVALPNTGAGTTAQNVESGAHVGNHYFTYCYNGILYRSYRYSSTSYPHTWLFYGPSTAIGVCY